MLIAMAVLLVWPCTGFAAELMVKVPVGEYRETRNKLDDLQRQIDAMAGKPLKPRTVAAKTPVGDSRETKNKLKELQRQIDALEGKIAKTPAVAVKKGEVAAKAPVGDIKYSDTKLRRLNRDISEIYDTLDEVETAALLDRINLGAEVRVRMDNYQVKNYQPMYVDFTPGSPTFGNWLVGTNMVPMYPAGAAATPFIENERNDSNWSSRFRINMDGDVSKTIKFAARLALQKNWADSMGVFMSTDNNRAHASDGTTNLKVDRFYIDWTPKFFTPLSISFGRLPTSDGPPLEFKEARQRQSIYPALIFDGEPDGIVATAGLERYISLKNSGLRFFYAMATQYDADHLSMNYMDSVTNDLYQDNRVQAVFFETELPALRDSLLVLSYVPAKHILMQSPYSSVGAAESVDNLGDITLYGAHLQLPNLFGSGLDFFASYGQNRNKPSGNTIDFAGVNFGLFSSSGNTPLDADSATTETTTGWAWYTGFRYELPVSVLNRPKLGFEYNRGNKYWFSFTPGASEIFNRLATRGEAFDVYYIQPFNKNLFLRTGYTKIVYEATGSGMPFGPPMEYVKDMMMPEEPEFHNFYILLDSRF
ncbi:MAG: DUF3373 family protein [Thermodesulfobacteriota bacterium]